MWNFWVSKSIGILFRNELRLNSKPFFKAFFLTVSYSLFYNKTITKRNEYLLLYLFFLYLGFKLLGLNLKKKVNHDYSEIFQISFHVFLVDKIGSVGKKLF